MAGQPLEIPGDEGAPHWRTVWRRFRKHRLAIASLGVFTLIALCAVFADWVAPYGATEQNLDRILAPPGRDFLLGTDTLGRDTLSRILYGGRISLLVGVSVALISGVVGTAVGLVAGYCRGWVDSALMRFTDTMLALPSLMVVIMAARILGDSVLDVVIVLAAVSWMVPARIVRAKVLSLCENQFVEAATALGVPGSPHHGARSAAQPGGRDRRGGVVDGGRCHPGGVDAELPRARGERGPHSHLGEHARGQ